MYRITIEEFKVDTDKSLSDGVVIYKKESNDFQEVKKVLKQLIDMKGDEIYQH